MFQQVRKAIESIITSLIHETSSLVRQKLVKYQEFHYSYCPDGLIGNGVYFAVPTDYPNNNAYVLKHLHTVENYLFVKFYLENPRQVDTV